MKNILDFLRESEELNRELLCNIYGGEHGWVSTSSSQITKNGNGQCQREEMVDSFNDCNGDGLWNGGESGRRHTTFTPVICEA